MARKILFVLTSNHDLGNTGKPTGFHLYEAAAPWTILKDAGFEIDFASPAGGDAPIEPASMDRDNEINRRFLAEAREKIDNTVKLEHVDASQYGAVYFAGGHGAMWDMPENSVVHDVVRKIYEDNDGVAAAICHGPAAFVGLKLSNGEYLVNGKRMSVFSDDEERLIGRDKVVPFLLASRLREQGAIHEMADASGASVSADGRLVTGQNPASAQGLGEKLLQVLQERQRPMANPAQPRATPPTGPGAATRQ